MLNGIVSMIKPVSTVPLATSTRRNNSPFQVHIVNMLTNSCIFTPLLSPLFSWSIGWPICRIKFSLFGQTLVLNSDGGKRCINGFPGIFGLMYLNSTLTGTRVATFFRRCDRECVLGHFEGPLTQLTSFGLNNEVVLSLHIDEFIQHIQRRFLVQLTHWQPNQKLTVQSQHSSIIPDRR